MTTGKLIAYQMPALSLTDTGEKALRLMNEYRVFHLPVIQKDNYIALISEDDILDWDTPEEPLSLAEFLTFRPAIDANAHPYEAIKIAKQFNLSLLPVIDEQKHFAGVVTIENLFSFATDHSGISEIGAIIIIEAEHRSYSMSEISRICESNELTILSFNVKTNELTGMHELSLKVNSSDVQALIATFERYNYNVTEVYSSEHSNENLRQNLDLLMHYLDI